MLKQEAAWTWQALTYKPKKPKTYQTLSPLHTWILPMPFKQKLGTWQFQSQFEEGASRTTVSYHVST
ncbi:hypothetical protein FF2_020751 [Malus domestica]